MVTQHRPNSPSQDDLLHNPHACPVGPVTHFQKGRERPAARFEYFVRISRKSYKIPVMRPHEVFFCDFSQGFYEFVQYVRSHSCILTDAWPEPDQYRRCATVNISHLFDLMSSFQYVFLINADSIYP
jgi:hypothetical protein